MVSSMLRVLGKFKNIFSKKTENEYIFIDGYFLHRTAKIINYSEVSIGKNTEIKDYVIMQSFGNITIGDNCQINPFTVLYGGNIYIGNNVMIAPHCMIASGNHDYKQMDKPMIFAGILTKGPIIIENDVWIGANVTVSDGVRIGEGSVIGSNSCVTKDVESYSIYAGVPAKKIGSRKII